MNKYLWIDTDIGGDCDDAGAIALANIASREGSIQLWGMTFTTSAPAGPACVSAINTYYGNSNIPVGMTSRQNFCQTVNPFQEYVAKHFPNDFYNKEADTFIPAEDAVRLLRRALSEMADNSLTFVCIGQLNNISDLLDSPPDEFSSLDGVELVHRKVKEFIVMGGLFMQSDEEIIFDGCPYKVEYNIVSDVKSAINFIKKNKVKTVFLDFIAGYKIFTGGSLLGQNNPQNPVTACYRIFQNKPRESWDPLTVLYAIYGAEDVFEISESGKVEIEADGCTIFSPDKKGNHYYIRPSASNEYCSQIIDQMLLRGGYYEKDE